ncbi:hypothetical protein Tco_0927548 [Tanacetum coccineum]
MSPFEVVYRWNPITPLDLVPIPEVGRFSEEWADQSEQIKELHWSVQEQIIRHNKQYKEHADKRRKQLKPRGDGPFPVLKKINDNAYKIERSGHYNVSATFNVADLSPYKGDSDDELDSWSSLFQEGEDDADAVNERVNVKIRLALILWQIGLKFAWSLENGPTIKTHRLAMSPVSFGPFGVVWALKRAFFYF